MLKKTPILSVLLNIIISDFVWSLSNDVILSVSLDGTARLWDVAAGTCMRVIEDGSGAELLTCLFQPLNNNMFVVSFQHHISFNPTEIWDQIVVDFSEWLLSGVTYFLGVGVGSLLTPMSVMNFYIYICRTADPPVLILR